MRKLLPEVQLFEVACWKNYPDSMPSDRTRKDYHEAFVVCWIHYKDSSSEIWYNGESGEWSETSVTRPLVEGSTKEVEKYTVYEKK
ncbi:MAG: hypothetical protein K6E50_12335 [Lachnospiraceae bacterium]|nr:hypothetical protein [Lachnospiraceae bacterium]